MSKPIETVTRQHAMPFGVQTLLDGEALFRLWAPAANQVELCIQAQEGETTCCMRAQGDGWFAAQIKGGTNCLYRFRIDDRHDIPDPASRYQPHDVHDFSQVIDPLDWQWTDGAWYGRPWHEAVIYELHVGTFTGEGSFVAIIDKLDYLVQLGVTAIQLMPIADFPGQRNWGYDGVLAFAPDSCYGRPEELKLLVQTAHSKGLMVLLDVVYNHFGPEGNYLQQYAGAFFHKKNRTPWGKGFNFDGKHSHWVRQFFIHNALYWLEEFHLDGLRLDAVQAMADGSAQHVLEELANKVRQHFGDARHIHLILENDDNAAHLLQREESGRPAAYTAQWNDDFHNALHVLLTGETWGYYQDYARQPLQYLSRSLTQGFAYQGEASSYRQGKPRGEVSDQLPPQAFINFLQNHDQIGNRPFAERIQHLAPAHAIRAVTALLLLAPFPPMLFMGQEWGCEQAFNFFCDFEPHLAKRVKQARQRGFIDMPGFAGAKARAAIPDPGNQVTFQASILDWQALSKNDAPDWLAFHRQLLVLRQQEIVPRLPGMCTLAARTQQYDGSTLQIVWRLGDGSHLHLVANLTANSVEMPHYAAKGRLIFATADCGMAALLAGQLAGWSVAYLLE